MIDREQNRKNQLYGGEDNLANRTWLKSWENDDDRIRMKLVLDNSEGLWVTDLGCSDGVMTIELARKGKFVIGVNMNQKGIDMAINNVSKEEKDIQDKVLFVKSDIENFEWHFKFDTLLCCEVLEHVYDPTEILNKIKELGKQNAKVIITVPNRNVKQGYMPRWELPGIHIREYTKETLTKQLEVVLQDIEFFTMYDNEDNDKCPFLICAGRLK